MVDSMGQLERDANATINRSASIARRKADKYQQEAFKSFADIAEHLKKIAPQEPDGGKEES